MNPSVRMSVVVPVFNAEQTLFELARQMAAVVGAADEVVFVDDGSRDHSWANLEGIIAEHPTWRALQLGRNSGQHAALLAGIRAATGPIVVTMDDDLQHRPSDIPVLVAALTEDVDLVYGVAREEEHGVARSLMSRVVKWALRAWLRVEHAERTGAFRCFRTRLRDAFAAVDDRYVSIDVLLSWATDRATAVEVDMPRRAAGRSGYTVGRLVRHALDMVTGYSAAPLRVVAYVGAAIGTWGFGALAYVLIRWVVIGASLPGLTVLASMMSLIGGIQMIAIAVIGEYLGKVHFRTMREPSSFVRRSIGGGA